jgi:hypothetical protein
MTTSSFVLGLLEFVSLDVCLDRVRAGSAATDHETQATQNTARHKLFCIISIILIKFLVLKRVSSLTCWKNLGAGESFGDDTAGESESPPGVSASNQHSVQPGAAIDKLSIPRRTVVQPRRGRSPRVESAIPPRLSSLRLAAGVPSATTPPSDGPLQHSLAPLGGHVVNKKDSFFTAIIINLWIFLFAGEMVKQSG